VLELVSLSRSPAVREGTAVLFRVRRLRAGGFPVRNTAVSVGLTLTWRVARASRQKRRSRPGWRCLFADLPGATELGRQLPVVHRERYGPGGLPGFSFVRDDTVNVPTQVQATAQGSIAVPLIASFRWWSPIRFRGAAELGACNTNCPGRRVPADGERGAVTGTDRPDAAVR
jgi:hypothetical protein